MTTEAKNKNSFIDKLLAHPWLHRLFYEHHTVKSEKFMGVLIDFCMTKAISKRLAPGSGSVTLIIDSVLYAVRESDGMHFVQHINMAEDTPSMAAQVMAFEAAHPGRLSTYMIRPDGSLKFLK